MDLENPPKIYLKINKKHVNVANKFDRFKICPFKPSVNGNGKGRQLTLILLNFCP